MSLFERTFFVSGGSLVIAIPEEIVKALKIKAGEKAKFDVDISNKKIILQVKS